ncbi:MAG: ATP synthase F1 subunit delta [Ghiorsea sp.]
MSGERTIARRYAVALFELHQEGTDIKKDLQKIAQVAVNDDAKALLINSQIPAEKRAGIIMKAASVDNEYVLRLITILAARKKGVLLPAISELLEQFVRDANAGVMVDVTVAIKMDKALAAKLKESISSSLGKQVELNVQQDASILGGMILNIGDRQIDHSVRGRLDGLKRALTI